MAISVILPFHQSAPYLEEAVRSCLAQKELGELILVNDAADEQPSQLARALVLEDSRVRLLEAEVSNSQGPAAARNRGIRESRFDFIAFLDADDVYEPNRFTEAISFLNGNPAVDGYYEPTGVFNHDFSQLVEKKGIHQPIASEDLFAELLLGRYGHFNTPGIVIRKTAFQKGGGFNEALRYHQDTDLWLRMAYHTSLGGNPYGLIKAKIRSHSKNHSQKAGKLSRIQLWETVIQYFNRQPVSSREWYLLLLRLATARFQPPSKREYLALPMLFFQYPMYFWLWLRKWVWS